MKNFSGSSYIFYRSNGNWYNWERSKTICEQSGYNLVSIESREEWNFLNRTIQKEDTIVNASSKGHWPWAIDDLTAKMRTARKCTEIILIALGAIMMSGALNPYVTQDSYVNLKVKEVIDP